MVRCVGLLLVLVVALSSVAQAQQPQVADLVIINAKVHTFDKNQPLAQAIAISDSRITAVGSNSDIRRFIGKKQKLTNGEVVEIDSRVLDGQSRVVVPGFNDSHVHFLTGGKQLSSVDLRDARTKEEFVRRIAAFAQSVPAGTWITGGDWDHENWASGELPTRDWIDAATTEHPVFVRRLDGHMGLANSLALSKAGMTSSTQDPPGGLSVRDANGQLTGVLKDASMNAVFAVIPDLTHEERLRAARAATDHAASLGVTSVQDMSGDSDVVIYRELLRSAELKTRIYAAAPLPAWQRSAARGFKAAQGDAWIRQGALKGFADGSLGSTTAYFFEPYLDSPQTSGLPSDEMFPAEAMSERIVSADKAGLHIMIHAIGDRANDQVLSFYEQLNALNGKRDRRCRIEHAQHLRSVDIPRFAGAGVIASMQPYHCADDGRWAEKRIGPQRAEGTYAFRSLIDSGAVLAFGSDWNVAPLDPIQGITAAVTRQTLDGKHPDGWVAEQKITVEEAVRAYTVGSAYAEFTEQDKGTIEPGKLADLVILTQDIFMCPVDQIGNTRVATTIVDGKVVFTRP